MKCWQTQSLNPISDAIDDPNVSYSAAVVEAEDSGSEQVSVETSDMVGQQHVALVTQEDGTQQQVTERSDITDKGAMDHITRGLDRIIFKIGEEEEEKGDKHNFEEEKKLVSNLSSDQRSCIRYIKRNIRDFLLFNLLHAHTTRYVRGLL